ncbi:DUF3429 domain-containing protein [Hoeflea sp.]|uniref:DUF3429 domain-containing protein n=1 Tax=Hoeflea sp. TaxID=1940281 RepID=UPI0019AF05A0|nr:DUF3429 domain-containing protein [Hoeflea sp.]MBC7281667.1 DUF3429 domain-containing protein [Hoeflea sp.]
MTATAWFLAGLGALPFLAMAVAGTVSPAFSAAHLGGDTAFLGYGAVILSFMGGVRWGRALTLAEPALAAEQMILSVAPSLAAWLALLIDRPWSLFLLAAGFALQAAWDWKSAGTGLLPAWFGRLRLTISAIVIASIALVMLA